MTKRSFARTVRPMSVYRVRHMNGTIDYPAGKTDERGRVSHEWMMIGSIIIEV